MAITAAREQSFVRALMYLGRAPRAPKRICDDSGQNAIRAEVDAYTRSMAYNDKVQQYFLKYVFQGPTSALGDTDTWIEDFYDWMRADVVMPVVHDEVTIREHNRA